MRSGSQWRPSSQSCPRALLGDPEAKKTKKREVIPLSSAPRASSQFNMSRMPRPPRGLPVDARCSHVSPSRTHFTLHRQVWAKLCFLRRLRKKVIVSGLSRRPQRLQSFWPANTTQQIQEFIGLTEPKRTLYQRVFVFFHHNLNR